MSIPTHLFRSPTRAAIESLSARFGFPNDPGMQDWEFEVADASRIDEFLAAYKSGELDEDERFTLMETIIQSFEDSDAHLESDARWLCTLELLDANIDLHGYFVWYWSCVDATDVSDAWRVTPSMRKLLAKHQAKLLGSRVPSRRFHLNASGDFYVEDGMCIACGAPEREAPELMSHFESDQDRYHCYFLRQPSTPSELEHAVQAVCVSCCGAVRYGGNDPVIQSRIARGYQPRSS